MPLAAVIALLMRRSAPNASRVLLVYTGLWWLLFKVPEVIKAPLTEVTWLDCAMFGMLVIGAWVLFVQLSERTAEERERAMRYARLLFGLCLIPTGISHFVYLTLTVPLIPTWLPFRAGLAYFTGACHLAAGLGLLFGVVPRLAAELEAAMLAIFTILVWVPRVTTGAANPGSWTEFWLSWALTAAAAVLAAYLPARTPAQA